MSHRLSCLMAAAAAMPLIGCTSFAPYPTHFQPGDVNAPTLPVDCDHHGEKEAVLNCLKARAQGWEAKGAHIRSENYIVGTLSIPLAATAIGLSAEHDPNHAAPILALVTGSGVAHASAFARGEQAAVDETALAGFDCLVRKAGTWLGAPFDLLSATNRAVEDALVPINADADQANSDLAVAPHPEPGTDAAASVADATSRLETITSYAKQHVQFAREAYDSVQTAGAGASDLGDALLAQADLIEGTARAAAGAQTPQASVVAASAQSSLKPSTSPPPAPTAPLPPTSTPQQAAKKAGYLALKTASSKDTDDATAYAAEVNALIAKFNADAATLEAREAEFKKAEAAYQPTKPTATACVATFASVAALVVDGPAPALKNGKTTFEVRGGVPPHVFVMATPGLTVNMRPSTGGVTVIDASVDNAATDNGPWDIQLQDAAGTPLTVHLTKP